MCSGHCPRGRWVSDSPSCQAAWAGKLEGRYWPSASSPTCPQAKPSREWSQRQENSWHHQNRKRPQWGCHLPASRAPEGQSKAFRPNSRLQLISQRKHIFLPSANRNRHANSAGSPRQRCCAGTEPRCPPRGEHFASCRLAVYSVNTSMAWATVAGDTGRLRGHCPLSPSHQCH